MNSMIWGLLVLKLIFLCWLIYYLLERRKRRASPPQTLAIIEQGVITTYAGAPVTQMPKNYNEYYQPQAAPAYPMPPNWQQTAYLNNQPNVMAKS